MYAILLAALLALGDPTRGETPPMQSLNSFETVADLQILKTNNVRFEPTSRHVTDGKQAIQVTFQPSEGPNIGFVTVTDTPYPEMVAAARAVHAGGYSYRSGHKNDAKP